MTDKDNDKKDAKTRHRELEEERRKRLPHAPRKDLHEDKDLHPHHKQSDHVRHHHLSHILKHHGKETAEEKKFIDHENKLHRIEMNREVWEDAASRKQLRDNEKVSATPALARKGTKVKSSSSTKIAEQLNTIRLRIAYARARSRERGEQLFGK